MIRQLFNALSLRDRYLMALFIWALVLLWLLYLLEGFQKTWSTYTLNKQALSSFVDTIAQADEAQVLLAAARQGLDSNKTFSSAQLVGRLDSIARENEVTSFDISTPSTIESLYAVPADAQADQAGPHQRADPVRPGRQGLHPLHRPGGLPGDRQQAGSALSRRIL